MSYTTAYREKVPACKHARYSTVVFDLDGTLIDTLADLTGAVNHALTSQGLPESSTAQVRAATGNGIRRLIERSVPAGTSEDVTDAVFEEFKRYYALHDLDATAPYPGIPALVERLRAAGARMAVASNKADFAVQRIISELMGDAFDAVAGEREGVARKPDAAMVDALLAQMGVGREDMVYVGDSEVDVKTAQNLGCACICCTWGFRDRAWLEEAGGTVFAASVDELEELLIG